MRQRVFFLTMLFLAMLSTNLSFGQSEKVNYENSWGQSGFTLTESKTSNVLINYSITEFTINDRVVEKQNMKEIALPNVFLPNEAGHPNLPGESKMIAIPEGSKPVLKIVNYEKEIIENIDIAPAPVIPLVTDETVIYKKNEKAYSQNSFYPAEPFKISEIFEIRGVDAIMLAVTPFQYNPTTKELIVYKNIEIEITFEGGKGFFGENKYRSLYWENILDDQLLNYNSLPQFDFASQNNSSKDPEADYVIITIDNDDFIAKAEEIAEFRRQQGISTMVVTTTEIGGNTVSAIETWIDNAYNNWTNPVDAVLLLGDYGSGNNGIISHLYSHPSDYPDFASDNKYADVNGDELPDVILARIAAENTSQLDVMVSKFMDYEQNPPTDANFYNTPITALGWQTERWFQICSEAIGGFWKNELDKNPVRINAVYDGNPNSDPWSTATNTSTVLNYFGPNGLGYIPATPSELGGWTGGDAGDVVNAINAGSFMLQHRDHGLYAGWGEPEFRTNDISSLTNVDNKLPFILSINCQTGAFHSPTGVNPSFTEAFHRYTYNGENSGALGLIAATEVSYSFVNDTYVWGIYDNMWSEFMPDETTEFPVNFVMPGFGNAAGKHFLEQSSWPYNNDSKEVTHRLFHHHGDAYLNVYTEVPLDLTVNCPDVLIFGETTLDMVVDENATIAITYYDDIEGKTIIVGTAISVNGTTSVNLTNVPNPGTQLLVTITKQNHFRYTKNVIVTAPTGPYDIVSSYTINDSDNNQAEFAETFNIDLTVKNVGVATSSNVEVTLTTDDEYVVALTNNTSVSFGSIDADATYTSTNSFTVELANNIPDGHDILFAVSIIDDESVDPYESNISINVNAPELEVGNMTINDAATGNADGILDPGETADLIIQTTNSGHANVTNLIGTISTASSYLTINTATSSLTELDIDQTGNFTFSVTASLSAPEGTPADILFDVTAGIEDQYSATATKELIIGFVPEYCEAGSSDDTDEWISRVQFVDIDNSSDIGGGYNDYTHISTDVITEESYPITITNGYHYSGDQMGCWIDWNYDGDFDDTNEEFTINYSDAIGTGTITIPENARIGTTTMRVRVMYSGSLSPCGFASYGEVEDYTLNVLPNETQGGTLNASTDNICEGSNTGTLELTNNIGIITDWEKRIDSGSWTSLGISTTTHSEVISTPGYWEYRVVADNGAAYSNIIGILVDENSVAGTASVDETIICENSEVTLSLSGNTGNIQWQSSTDENTWTNISGATTTPFSTNVASDKYYQAEVANGACEAAYSNSILVETITAPDPDFDYDFSNSPEISFTNTSTDADSYSWDFGDEIGTSTEENPTYTYTDNGYFTVTLSASNSYCNNFQDYTTLSITTVSISEFMNKNVVIYPNPATDILNIVFNEIPENMTARIINIDGKVIVEKTLTKDESQIELNNLTNGVYILEISNSKSKTTKTLIIK